MAQSWRVPTVHEGESFGGAIIVVDDDLQISKTQRTASRVTRVCHILLKGDILKFMEEGFEVSCASLGARIYECPVKGC
jgi:hypothetical protein